MALSRRQSAGWQWAWIILLALAVVGGVYPRFTGDKQFHFVQDMELMGGVRLFYSVTDTVQTELDSEEKLTEQLELCRIRLEARLREFYERHLQVLAMEGEGVLVEVPGTTNIRKVLDSIGHQGSVTIRGVIGISDERPRDADAIESDGSWIVLDRPAIVGSDLEFGELEVVQENREWGVAIPLTKEGKSKLTKLAATYFDKPIAIMLDDELVSLPVLQTRGGGTPVLSPYPSLVEAEITRRILASGPLPISLELKMQQSVGPLFGKSLRKSALQGFTLGIVSLIGFLSFAYMKQLRFWVVLLASSVFASLLLVTTANLGWIVLSLTNGACAALLIGMSVDSQVVLFEEIIHRFERGRQVDRMIRESFKSAFFVVMMGNLTTILALSGLYFSEGVLRNYFILVFLGIVINTCSFVFSYAMTQHLAGQRSAWDRVGSQKRPWIDKLAALPEHRLIGPGSPVMWWMMVIPISCLIAWKTLDIPWGNELSGGTEAQFTFSSNAPDEAAIHQTVNKFFDDTCQIQRLSGEQTSYVIRTRKVSQTEDGLSPLLKSLEERLDQDVNLDFVRAFSDYQALEYHDDIIASVGFSLVIIFFVFLGLYGGALMVVVRIALALAIDFATVVLVVICFNIPISLPIVAALVTIIGYSVNDSIIVAHKIMEYVKSHGQMIRSNPNSFPHGDPETNAANVREALKYVMSRVVITSTSTAVVLVGLLLMGQGILRDYAIVMLFGVISGTLTSFFVVGCRSVELGYKERY